MASNTGSAEEKPNLVRGIADQLRREIASGVHGVGARMPTELKLSDSFQVSRSVVREAIASLRAEGLLRSRRGSGIYVERAEAGIGTFSLSDHTRISTIMEVLEFRIAVEVEAAALAAMRSSPSQDEAIFERNRDIQRALAEGRPTNDADFAFHQAVADASGNSRFRDFLDVMGNNGIPRLAMRGAASDIAVSLEHIVPEHDRIARAIAHSDKDAARDAMRFHLEGSLRRYRDLMHDRSPDVERLT
ncbi:FadR/GntR family transcriptional regulator [Bosea sp. 685]|uniref:FadR/GntR family transcriptional regulator n=1 Tax=Bosea sp. 685 TaxID=3080057 RepID=UPI002892D290|nr:FadR/GntR family transcriptional regulator [Bosea sp. 685]WNJ88034.1 FadR/GntR family transcriptional regulator [Bosea sp. 685]